MANDESFVLDGLDLSSLASPLGIREANVDPPAPRYEWSGAADSEAQVLVRDALHVNREIVLKIQVSPQATMDLALAQITAVRDKLKKASATTGGIPLVWTPATATLSCTFDVFAGHIEGMPIDWENGWLLAKAPTIVVRLICAPYWRGTEVLTITASASAPIVTLEVASVTGDVPALGRLIVTDTASQSRRHVEWGLEGPATYNSGTSLLLDSDSLVTSGFAGTQTTLAGAYDPNASGNSVISTALLPSPVACCGTGDLSHIGTFRVKARVCSNVGADVRLAWRAGDGTMTANTWVPITVEGAGGVWSEIDLGTITISPVTAGTQRWTGQIEATGLGLLLLVDYLVLVPTSCGYGKARSAQTASGTSVVTGYDNFTGTTTGGALNTRTAVLGGTWATSGATTDFVFADALGDEQIVRSTSSDAGPRFAVLGATSYTDAQVEANVRRNSFPTSGNVEQGVICRWTDSSNYLRAVVWRDGTTSARNLSLVQRVAGTDTTLASVDLGTSSYIPNSYYCIRLVAYASGRALVWFMDSGKSMTFASLEASSTALATAGTLATGKPGIYDYQPGSGGGNSRYFDDFGVATPAPEPIVLYSGRNMQIRHDTVIRQDSTGTYTGEPPSCRGDRFTVPVGTSRVLVKARRNDVDVAADPNVTDSLQIQVAYTPRGLVVPR